MSMPESTCGGFLARSFIFLVLSDTWMEIVKSLNRMMANENTEGGYSGTVLPVLSDPCKVREPCGSRYP